jgi:hypothetical protein
MYWNINKVKCQREFVAVKLTRSLLIKAGGNKNGINSACRVITGN